VTYLCEGNVLERYCWNDHYVSCDDICIDGCMSYEYNTLSEWIFTLYYLLESVQRINVTGGDGEHRARSKVTYGIVPAS